ncbi:MAG: hypothetical protein KAU12_00070 [Candidatus Omnitrophica bacterium]|nr:hypothetical protein [Candidatus Omnitrophota bacterium]
MICHKCQKEAGPEDSYCRFCGAGLGNNEVTPWYSNISLIILLAVFFPIVAIPFIWRNPQFSPKAKKLSTTACVMYTLFLIGMILYFFFFHIGKYYLQIYKEL